MTYLRYNNQKSSNIETLNFKSGFIWYFSVVVIFFTILQSCYSHKQENKTINKPNILLILADDLGYSDLGCFGGEIHTPNIDGLAREGMLFTNFHTSPYCAPTRAMLLSGNDNHIAGMGSQSLVSDQFGYEGSLSERIATIPQVLKKAGYNTYIAGKWHLGRDSDADPVHKGFSRSFVNLGSSGNHYNDQGLFRGMPRSIYTENGKKTSWPEDVYSTDFFTDKLIEFIHTDKESNKPFFAFAAYTSPHWPLQVDKEYSDKYVGHYDQGYEWLKKERFQGLIDAGIIAPESQLPEAHSRVIPWDQLSQTQKQKESRKMELYAGMVDNLDENIGRLLAYLKDIDEFDNTLIIFLSDNGPAGEDFYYHKLYGPFLQEHFTDQFEDMGLPNSFISYGPQWAEAGSAPFRYFKGQMTEGGIRAPLIISGLGLAKNQILSRQFLTVMDLAPTLYEISGTQYPEDRYPLKGKSIVPLLKSDTQTLHKQNYVFALEHREKAMLRKGNWKIINLEPPFEENKFELYNLENDQEEGTNLRQMNPDKYNELLNEWNIFSREIQAQYPPPYKSSTIHK